MHLLKSPAFVVVDIHNDLLDLIENACRLLCQVPKSCHQPACTAAAQAHNNVEVLRACIVFLSSDSIRFVMLFCCCSCNCRCEAIRPKEGCQRRSLALADRQGGQWSSSRRYRPSCC